MLYQPSSTVVEYNEYVIRTSIIMSTSLHHVATMLIEVSHDALTRPTEAEE